jgi:hypothetical protein
VRVWHFLRSLPYSTPERIPTILSDWVVALSMREFAGRRLALDTDETSRVEQQVDSVRSAIGRYLADGKVGCALRPGPAPNLSLSLLGMLDAGFFTRVARPLEQLLRHTHASLTLRINSLHAPQLRHLQRLLQRLACHGDRISIVLDERLRSLLHIDSSVFHLVLAAPSEADSHANAA